MRGGAVAEGRMARRLASGRLERKGEGGRVGAHVWQAVDMGKGGERRVGRGVVKARGIFFCMFVWMSAAVAGCCGESGSERRGSRRKRRRGVCLFLKGREGQRGAERFREWNARVKGWRLWLRTTMSSEA